MKASGIAAALLLVATTALGVERTAVPSSVPLDRRCDRACLYRSLDGFLDALRQRDPWHVSWAKDALVTENNVPMPELAAVSQRCPPSATALKATTGASVC